MLLFPIWQKTIISFQIRVLQKGEHVWSWIVVIQPCANTSSPQNILQESSSTGLVIREAYRKNAIVAFHCTPPIGLVFFHWVDCILKLGFCSPPVLYYLWDFWVSLITLASLCANFCVCEKSTLSYQIMLLRKGEDVWNWFQVTEAHWKQPVPTEPLAGGWLYWSSYKPGKGGKKAKAVFIANHHRHWWFFTEWVILCKLDASGLPFLVIWEIAMGDYNLSIALCCFPLFG